MLKKISAVIFITIIVIVNFALIYPYLTQDFPRWISSIEVGFITMSRWFAQDFGRSWWVPQWYAGIPFHLLYAPLIPATTAVLGSIIQNFGQAYHLTSGLFFLLVPVALWLVVYKLTKSQFAAFVAAIFYSLAPTFGLLFPQVHTALFGKLAIWRIIILVYYGEGPHTASLFFALLSGYFTLSFLEQKKLTKLVLSALFMALTALSNSIGLFGLLLFLTVIYFAWGFWQGKWNEAIKYYLANIVLGFLLAMFWYNPSFLANDIAGEGGQVGLELFHYFPWRFLGIMFLVVVILGLLKKAIKDFSTGVSVLWFMTLFVLLGFFYYGGITAVPQVRRFLIEFDLAGAMVVGLLVMQIPRLLAQPKLHKPMGYVLGSLIVIGVGGYLFNTWSTLEKFLKLGPYQKEIQLTDIREYQMSNWLKNNTDSTDRVFLSANYTFWLNYFTDVWQMRGDHFQASIIPWEPHAGYQITAGEDAEVSLLWAKIFNLRYIVINPKDSQIHYQDYLYPEKFDGYLPIKHQVLEDIVYEVIDLPGMARNVNLQTVNNLKIPDNGADRAALAGYTAWLVSGQPAVMRKIDNDHYQITTSVDPGEGIRIAMAYDKGWKAVDEVGHKVAVKQDALGFILLGPKNSGRQMIKMNYFPPLSVWIGVIASIATYAALIFFCIIKIFKPYAQNN